MICQEYREEFLLVLIIFVILPAEIKQLSINYSY